MIKKIAKYAVWGLVIGYLAAILSGRWTWLEMRVNTSFLLPAALIGGVLAGYFYKNGIRKIYFFLSEGAFLAVFFMIYRDLGAFAVLPAARLREGFFLSFLSLEQINFLLVLILGMGNILWLFRDQSCCDC